MQDDGYARQILELTQSSQHGNEDSGALSNHSTDIVGDQGTRSKTKKKAKAKQKAKMKKVSKAKGQPNAAAGLARTISVGDVQPTNRGGRATSQASVAAKPELAGSTSASTAASTGKKKAKSKNKKKSGANTTSEDGAKKSKKKKKSKAGANNGTDRTDADANNGTDRTEADVKMVASAPSRANTVDATGKVTYPPSAVPRDTNAQDQNAKDQKEKAMAGGTAVNSGASTAKSSNGNQKAYGGGKNVDDDDDGTANLFASNTRLYEAGAAPLDSLSRATTDSTNLFGDRAMVAQPGAFRVDGIDGAANTIREMMDAPRGLRHDSTHMSENNDNGETNAPTAPTSVNAQQPIPAVSVAQAICTNEMEEELRNDIISSAVAATRVQPALSANSKHNSDEDTDDDDDIDDETAFRSRLIMLALAVVCGCLTVLGIVLGVLLSKGTSSSSSSSSSSENANDDIRTTPPTIAPQSAGTLRNPLTDKEADDLEAWLEENLPYDDTVTSDDAGAFNWLVSVSARVEAIGQGTGDLQPSASNPPFDTKDRILQYYALADLYHTFKGDDWNENDNWLTTSDDADRLDYCNWHGIVCFEDDGTKNVKEVRLSSNNLVGIRLPRSIGLFSHATYFDINGNPINRESLEMRGPEGVNLCLKDGNGGRRHSMRRNLQGTQPKPQGIPTTVGFMTNLEALLLGGSGLGGTIPTQMGNLIKLTTISLHDTYVVLQIPSEIGRLAELADLNLSTNFMCGQLPSQLGELSKLTSINIEKNSFSGTIPSQLMNWPASIEVFIRANRFLQEDTVQNTFCSTQKFLTSDEFALEASCGEQACSCCTSCCADGFCQDA